MIPDKLGAYELADMTKPCPNCGADPWTWCRAGHGHPRRVPCLKRITKLPEPEPVAPPGNVGGTG